MSIESAMPSNHLILYWPLLLLPSIFPVSGSSPMSWLFTSNGQIIGASAWVLPMNIQGWFPLEWTDFISLLSRRLSRVFSSTTIWMHQFFDAQPSLLSNSHIPYMTTGKTIALTIQTFVSRTIFLFNTLSRFVIAFLPRSKSPLISWVQSPSLVILSHTFRWNKTFNISLKAISLVTCKAEPWSVFITHECLDSV